MFIKVPITGKMIEAAKEFAGSDAAYNKNSYRKGGGNLLGALGNVVVMNLLYPHYKERIKFVDRIEYDFILDDLLKIEVKTKHQNVDHDVDPEWECCVYESSRHQFCHTYIFVRIIYDFDKVTPLYGVILGKKNRVDFFNEAIYLKAGDIDPYDSRYTIPHTCYNLKIKHLDPIEFKA